MQEARSKQTNIDLKEHRFKHGTSNMASQEMDLREKASKGM